MEEAINSSLLEGASTTRKKGMEMLLSGKKPRSHPDKMIFNNYITGKRLAFLKEKPLTAGLIKEIHISVTQDILPDQSCGRFRKDADHIKVWSGDGNLLYEPPPEAEINARLESLIKFANEDKPGPFIHPVIKTVILHFTMSYIHPFADGSGRVAKALFYWHMLKKGYWLIEYLAISKIIRESRAQYDRAFLHSEQDDQDLTCFLHYNLRVICSAIKRLGKYLADRQEKYPLIQTCPSGFPI